jgi:hypothetical protein
MTLVGTLAIDAQSGLRTMVELPVPRAFATVFGREGGLEV